MKITNSGLTLGVLFGALAVMTAVVVILDAASFLEVVNLPFSPESLAMAGISGAGLSFKKGDAADDGVTDSELAAEIERLKGEVKGFAEDVIKKMKAGGDVSEELKQKADEALTLGNELKSAMTARLDDLEQKLARRAGEEPEHRRTPGEVVVEHEDVKNFMTRRPGRGSVKVEMKAVTSAAASAGDLVEEDRRPGILMPGLRRLTVRDLITPGRTSSNAIQYVKETGFTNSAAVVSETVQKPESDLTFDLVTRTVATVAHWVHASKQILDDAPMLQSYIDGRLRYGLAYAEEVQLLNGDGTGENLSGLVTEATAYSAPITISGSTMLDTLRLAMLQAELAEFPATGQVLNPKDWARIELTKDTQGRYLIANPANSTQPRLWGLPVVSTQAMAEDDFLVGAFMLGAQVFDREDADVEISTEDRDNFVKNMVTIRAEERLALAVYRPEAFVYGDFGNISG